MKINAINLAACAGLLGGVLAILGYAGIQWSALGMVAQIAGALGIIAVLWVAYDYFIKKKKVI